MQSGVGEMASLWATSSVMTPLGKTWPSALQLYRSVRAARISQPAMAKGERYVERETDQRDNRARESAARQATRGD